MAYAGMARHGKSSFNEGKAVRLLEQFLEQKDTIKTFFKENDRTPNYDGSMELVESDGTPVKKFIVQIKKCENLEPNQIGKNKGNTIQEDDEEKGLVLFSTGRTLQDFLDRRMLFTDSIHCLLYQGVCEELGYECKGLCWSGMNYSLFV